MVLARSTFADCAGEGGAIVIYGYFVSSSKLAIYAGIYWKAYDNEDGPGVLKACFLMMVFPMVSNSYSSKNPRKVSHLTFLLIIEWE